MMRSKKRKKSIVFRKAIPEIPSTTHGAFSVYKYPAKFIPQVVAFALKKYANKGDRVFDPFAGCGTVGTVAKVYGNDYELWDLNPLLDVIHKTATAESCLFNVRLFMSKLMKSKGEFLPEWKNLSYWFPDEFLALLSRSWSYAHSLPVEQKYKVFIPLIKTTKYFSWCDDKLHKLNRSKQSKAKVARLLKSNWEHLFYSMLSREISSLIRKLVEYRELRPKNVNYRIRSGIDALDCKLEKDANLLITSPPYLQAQEYIRSTKMALYWLGYDDDLVKSLGKKEIPYRSVDKIDVHSDLFYECREKIESEALKKMYDNYFYSILGVFGNIQTKIKDYMCIFVGPASIRTIPIPIDDIVVQHIQNFGWKHKITYIDKIVGRVMFDTGVNPATGLKDRRISNEYLVILSR